MKNLIGKSFRAIVLTGTFAAASAFAQTSETTTTTTSTGTISEFGKDTMTIRSDTSPKLLPYSYTETTTYEDESGVPVPINMVKQGLPVTVSYMQVGDKMVASKVVVKKTPVLEETTTTTESAQ